VGVNCRRDGETVIALVSENRAGLQADQTVNCPR
jgi:hypothetical protein